MAALSQQTNLAVNTNKSQVYFEDSASPLSYNYKTDQWSRLPAYAGIGFYDVLSGLNIGLVRTSGTAVDLQQPDSDDPASEATLITGESTFNDGSRRMITGVRPLLTGADGAASIIYRDELNPDTRSNYIFWSTDLTNAAWSTNNANVTNGAQSGPFGEANTSRLAGDGTAGAVWIQQSAQSVGAAPQTLCASVFLKSSPVGGTDYVRFSVESDIGATGRMVCSSLDGVIQSVGSGLTAYGSEAHANSWFRFWFVYNTLSDATPLIELRQVDASDNNIDGTASNVVGGYGVQIELASSMGEYVETEGAVVSSQVQTSPEQTINSRSGIAGFRVESRYHKIKIRASGGFTTILGADVEFEPSGEI
jgi:hypothetical protein